MDGDQGYEQGDTFVYHVILFKSAFSMMFGVFVLSLVFLHYKDEVKDKKE